MRNKKLIILLAVFAVITTLIILSSVIFSVQSVYAYCYNADDSVTDEKVASAEVNGIKRGKSIFMLNEGKIIAAIEDNVSDVMVVNVERKFPNRVYINYVKIYPTLVVESTQNAVALSPSGKVMSVREKASKYDDLIVIKGYVGEVDETVGNLALEGGSSAQRVSTQIIDAMISLGKYGESAQMLEFIDVSKLASSGRIFVKTRSGAYFELQGDNDIDKKMQLAVSVYFSNETAYMNSGTIIVNSSGKSASYTAENRYN